MNEHGFIVRVYGIFIDPAKGVLVSDEFYNDSYFTKFPGGGLEYGESPGDALKRELMEETGIEFNIVEHFYTTDFFVESAFHPGRQVISIYYYISTNNDLSGKLATERFVYDPSNGVKESFRFIAFESLQPEDFTFPADRRVAELLIARR